MFKAYVDDECFYDDRMEQTGISDLKVTLEENKAGSFEFNIYPENQWFNSFEKLNSIVIVRQNGVIIFRGRVLNSEESFFKERKITCEGEYAFLNDGILYPFGAEPVDENEETEAIPGTKYTPFEIFSQIITDYNSQVPEERRFLIGNVSVTGYDEDISYYNLEFKKSMDAMDDLLEECGGHLVFRHEEEGTYIDWTDEYSEIDQDVEFGVNLLDLVQTINGEDLITGILPHGDDNEDTNLPTNISTMKIETTDMHMQLGVVPDAPDNSRDEQFGEYGICLVNVPLYQKYGLILEERSYDGYPADWKDQLIADVDGLTGLANSIEVSAVDMAWLNDVEFFQLGRSVRVHSEHHGMDALYDITKLEIDLQDPASNKFTLGKVINNFVEEVTEGNKVKPIDGQSIKITGYEFAYAVSDNGTEHPDDDRFSTTTAPVQGKWLWTRVTTKYNDGTETKCYYPSYTGADAKSFRIKADSTVVVRDDRRTDAQTVTFAAEISGYPDALPIWYIAGQKVGEGGTYSRSIPYKDADGFTIHLYNGTTLMDTLTLTVMDKTGGGVYLGAFDTAIPTQTSDGKSLIKGDYFLATGTFGAYIAGEPYVFDGESFVAVNLGTNVTPAEYGDIMSTALDDALESDAVENSKFFAWFRKLASKEIFTRYLVAHNLHVAKGDFEFNVRTTDDEGNELEVIVWEVLYRGNPLLKINPNDGTIVSNGENFSINSEGSMHVKNGYFSGTFDCDVIKTELGAETDEGTQWTLAEGNAWQADDLVNKIRTYVGGSNEFSSGYIRVRSPEIPELAYISASFSHNTIGGQGEGYYTDYIYTVSFFDQYFQGIPLRKYFNAYRTTQWGGSDSNYNTATLEDADSPYSFIQRTYGSSHSCRYIDATPTIYVVEGENALIVDCTIQPSTDEITAMKHGQVYADSSGILHIKTKPDGE